uniref:Triadin n=1 Tax=Astyanax mexicanus TaxID=7994 RepID=A0A8B9KBF0_ASTMX
MFSVCPVGAGAESTPNAAMDPQNKEAMQPGSPKASSHGFMRVLNRPAQWLLVITLLVSWSAAAVYMFDFVSEEHFFKGKKNKNKKCIPLSWSATQVPSFYFSKF